METDRLPSVSIPNADKYVHFIEYFTLFTAWFMYLFMAFKKSFFATLFTAFFSAVLFGIIIEVLQGELTTHRSFDWGDVFSNSLGAFTSGFILYFFHGKISNLRSLSKKNDE